MFRDDALRFRHMLEAAKEAISFAHGKTRNDLDIDRKLALSLVKSIEIIGEAASRITRESQEKVPQIPWNNVISMRNRLIHAYFDMDMDRVWETVTEDIPPLVNVLEKILQDSDFINNVSKTNGD